MGSFYFIDSLIQMIFDRLIHSTTAGRKIFAFCNKRHVHVFPYVLNPVEVIAGYPITQNDFVRVIGKRESQSTESRQLRSSSPSATTRKIRIKFVDDT